eukprot:scaffold130302_cov33-Tisochrysis_lutea.AAC.2
MAVERYIPRRGSRKSSPVPSGAQKVAPNSMMAWFRSPGFAPPPASTSRSASTQASLSEYAGRFTLAVTAESRERTRRTLPSTMGAGTSKQIEAIAPAV